MTDFTAARIAMVDCQVRPSDVTLYPVIDAMLSVPREDYVPQSLRDVAYAGEHLGLAADRVVLDPRIFAKMLDALNLGSGDLVLDVGCGLGYSSAVIAHLAQAVISVEEDVDMAKAAATSLSEAGHDNVVVETGPLAAGWPDAAPYDAILLQGGIEAFPDELAAQMKAGSRVAAIFVEPGTGSGHGQVRIGAKIGDTISWRTCFDAVAPVLPGFHRAANFVF